MGKGAALPGVQLSCATSKLPGRDLYPHDLTRGQIERYVQQHPEDKAAIYDPYTVVKRRGGRLIGVPYHEEYKRFIDPMAKALRDAATLSSDAAFSNFLRLRADALLSDDYYKSDLAWLDLKDPKFDVIFTPEETQLDDLLGIKTSYGASVLIRSEEESRKLVVYQRYVPDMQDALPLPAADRPSKRGHLTPMEVMDAPIARATCVTDIRRSPRDHLEAIRQDRSAGLHARRGAIYCGLDEAIWVNPRCLSGAPCLRGTRVPVQSLIDLLEGGEMVDQFLELCPSVTRQQVLTVLDLAANQILECASSLTTA